MQIKFGVAALAACVAQVAASPYSTTTASASTSAVTSTAKTATTVSKSPSGASKVSTSTSKITTSTRKATTSTSKVTTSTRKTATSTSKITTSTSKASTSTSKAKTSTSKKTTTTTTTTNSTTTTTSSASATATTLACTTPTIASRPSCNSSSFSDFNLQLGKCGTKYDNLYLDPVRNETANSANVFVNGTALQGTDTYEYPPSFSFGPWAWRGEFAGGASNAAVPDLQAPIFSSNTGDWDCGVSQDLVPFDCNQNGNTFKFWYVESATGEVFAAFDSVVAKGYEQVVPYIVQGCSA